jgi:beta-fructofuranosidase
MLKIPKHYLGDSWFFVLHETVHVYFLVCPDTTPRHTRWSVGHATSTDLEDWQYHGIVLDPGEPDAWDGRTLATGSVIARGGRFWMAYTGNFAGPVPATGLAVSQDLFTWEKCPGNPTTVINPQVYSASPNLVWKQPRWRDPFLLEHKGRIYQIVTAARKDCPTAESGTVGVAVTDDFSDWEIQTPLEVPPIAQDLECPKLYGIDDRFFLVVSISEPIIADGFRALQPEGSPIATAYCLVADKFEGPYHVHGNGRILRTAQWGFPYAGHVVKFRERFWMLGTHWSTRDGDSISDPIPLTVTHEGFRTP